MNSLVGSRYSEALGSPEASVRVDASLWLWRASGLQTRLFASSRPVKRRGLRFRGFSLAREGSCVPGAR